jgi:hypothetical protein
LRDEYRFKKARLRFWEEEAGLIENEFDDEYDVMREREEADEDQCWGMY